MRGVPEGSQGFSLVEMMVALLLTAILMAGMARVFRQALGGSIRGQEGLSLARRGRVGLDLIGRDLLAAGLMLQDPALPAPTLASSQPMFHLEPNQPVAGAGPASRQDRSDVLSLLLDQEVSGDGWLESQGGEGHALAVQEGRALASTMRLDIRFPDDSTPTRLHPGQLLLFPRGLDELRIEDVVTRGRTATLTVAPLKGEPGGPRHPQPRGTMVRVIEPAQYVRYRIEVCDLGMGILRPCLVRDQFDYGDQVADPIGARPRQHALVAEDIVRLKVYLSRDQGRTWSGFGRDGNTFATAHGPDLGAGFEVPDWLRDRPVLVRVDLAARTPLAREEYSRVRGELAHRERVQTLVLAPRHAGMPW